VISVLDSLAGKIDKALDEEDVERIDQFLIEISSLLDGELSRLERACLHFYSANCYSMKRIIEGHVHGLSWGDKNLEKEIYSLRLSLFEFENITLEEDGSDLRFRVETNLANALNHAGRFVEAIELWDEVMRAFPRYAMAIGNRGHCLSWYARYLYDPGHQPLFFNESYHQVKKALDIGVEDHAEEGMTAWLEELSSLANWEEFEFNPKDESRGRSKAEREYRTWCIENRLFLNPLNDIFEKDIVANDVLTFPSIVTPVAERESMFPEVYGIYNQLKQEYVSTRYIMYEAIEESDKKLHFSDKRVKLYDMLDYRKYRLWIEKLKMAFLASYAIFDKIAYLVNEHWELSVKVQRVQFNTVWNKSGDRKRPLADKFQNSDNWPLRGLYWLSKDLYFKRDDDQSIEPDARHLNHIRNHIAHKYLRVYDDFFVDAKSFRENEGHELHYSIGGEEFIAQSIKLLKLVRSSLIYLSLAAHAEEARSRQKRGGGLMAEMELYEVEDSYRL
jgi:tetratricopeptide (TPR) repeat protein